MRGPVEMGGPPAELHAVEGAYSRIAEEAAVGPALLDA